MRLNAYLVATMLKSLMPVMLLLLGLFSFLALADELERVGEGSYTVMNALAVIALTLPNRLLDLLPVVVLLGALTGLGGLAGNGELTAARSLGRSPWQLMSPAVVTALLIGLLLSLAAQYVVPLCERQAERQRALAYEDVSITSKSVSAEGGLESALWIRSDEQIIRVGQTNADGSFSDVEFYYFEDNELASVRHAERVVVLDEQRWELQQAHVLEAPTGGLPVTSGRLASQAVTVRLPADRLALLSLPPSTLSLGDLQARIEHFERNGIDAHALRVLLWRRLSLPLATVAMMALAFPFVFGSTRSRSVGERVTIGVLAGIGFFLVEQSCSQAAVIYRLDPAILAMLPEVAIMLLVGLWFQAHQRP